MKDSLIKRVLVTGGAGFLGSRLCDRLTGMGCDVLCADNFYTGTKRNDDPKQRKPETTLAETRLGWSATTSLCDGLKPTIEYIDAFLKKPEQNTVQGG